MQPDERRSRKQRQGVARARILIKKHLGWLPGFPLSQDDTSVTWFSSQTVAGRDAVVTVDRERIRATEMALTKLRRRFPHALPRVVPDVESWLRRMDHLLAWIKNAIHQGASFALSDAMTHQGELLPQRVSAQWRRSLENPRIPHALANAIVFLETTGVSEFDPQAVLWLERHADALQAIESVGLTQLEGFERQVLMYRLHPDLPSPLQTALLRCLGDPRLYVLADCDPYFHARALSQQLKLAASSSGIEIPARGLSSPYANKILQLLQWLAARRPKARNTLGNLLWALMDGGAGDVLGGLCEHVGEEEARLGRELKRLAAKRLTAPSHRVVPDAKRLKKSAEVVESKDTRFASHFDQALSGLARLHESTDRALVWTRFLQMLPASPQLRAALFSEWEGECHDQYSREKDIQDLTHLLSQWTRMFHRRNHVHPLLVDHWTVRLAHRNSPRREFVIGLLGEELSINQYTLTVHILEETLYDLEAEPGPCLLDSLGEFAKSGLAAGDAAALISILSLGDDDYFFEDTIQAATSLTSDLHLAARILKFLNEAEEEITTAVSLLGRHLSDARIREIAALAASQGDRKLLVRLAAATQLAIDQDRRPSIEVIEGGATQWMDRYPVALLPPLKRLQAVAENACEIAEKILAKDFPTTDAIRREIESLEERLADADTEDASKRERIGKRLGNLRARLAEPSRASAGRIANLTAKIESRARSELVNRFLQACHRLAAEGLRATIGADDLTEDFLQAPNDQLLAAISQFGARRRRLKSLGLQLLWSRYADRSVDFLEHPANQEFRGRIESQGISLKAWLSDDFIEKSETKRGEAYRLAFTRDPLDYMLMGAHFHTCLAPGACNFFSTIANAVDLNKQVVFGRTEDGRVVGRCLFALSDEGEILTYYRYAHNREDGFSEAVDRFAQALAEAMKTQLASSGRVPNLLADDWYDDGPQTVAEQLAVRDPDGPVRNALRTATPGEVLERLTQVLGSSFAVQSALGELLQCDELLQRPEIVERFARDYAFDRDVGFNERFRLALLACKAEHTEMATAIVASLRPHTLPRRLKQAECAYCNTFHDIGEYQDVVDLLIRHNPTIALRVMRATRQDTVHQDVDESQEPRRLALARIHQALGRDRLAAQLKP